MWIIILAIICELILGFYAAYLVYQYDKRYNWYAIGIILLTISIVINTYRTLI